MWFSRAEPRLPVIAQVSRAGMLPARALGPAAKKLRTASRDNSDFEQATFRSEKTRRAVFMDKRWRLNRNFLCRLQKGTVRVKPTATWLEIPQRYWNAACHTESQTCQPLCTTGCTSRST